MSAGGEVMLAGFFIAVGLTTAGFFIGLGLEGVAKAIKGAKP